MKLTRMFVIALIGLLFAACGGSPTADLEATSQTATAAAQVVSSPTPAPSETPAATDTPAATLTPVPTATAVPTEAPAPTDTPVPAPTDTPPPTDTPVPEVLPAPDLLAPPDGDTFAGIATDITFQWSAAPRPLAEDEYYVLIITHSQGKDYTWTKTTSYSITQNKDWLAEFGPELKWQVVIARQTPEEAAGDPTGHEISEYSLQRACYWNI